MSNGAVEDIADASPVEGAAFPNAPPPTAFDAGDEPAEPTFGGGGPFVCGNCICDGTLDYCTYGGAPLASIADAGACDLDASACHRLPIACLPKPSCECLVPAPGQCVCKIDPSGNGLLLGCSSHGGPH